MIYVPVVVEKSLKNVVGNKMKKKLTLTIVQKNNYILLGLKKRGFGLGRWNGFGGKVCKNETIKEAAVRELKEESGIIAKDINRLGVLEFHFENLEDILEVHVYKVTDFSKEPIETEEMKPKWFSINEIPFDLMWPDDIYWMPYLLNDKRFIGKFIFDKPSDNKYQSKIKSYDIKEV